MQYLRFINEIFRAEQIADYFSQFGPVRHVELCIQRSTGLSKGTAYVTFEDEQSAREALVSHFHSFDGGRAAVWVRSASNVFSCKPFLSFVARRLGKTVESEMGESLQENAANCGALLRQCVIWARLSGFKLENEQFHPAGGGCVCTLLATNSPFAHMRVRCFV